MRVLFLTQWFDPEPVPKGLGFIKALRDAGHDIDVVTGFPNYPGGKIYPGYRIRLFQRQVIDGITVDRLPLYPSHDRSALRRAFNYLSFFLSALIYGLIRARSFDVIYVYHPPITPALAASLFCGLWRKPIVLDTQDLWPDSVTASGMADAGALSRVLGALCNFAYRRAAVVTAQSQGIRQLLIDRGVPQAKLELLYNWADEAAVVPGGRCDLAPYALENRFNIVYAGNLGRAQALETLIEAAQIASKDAPQIQLLLIGNGVEASALTAFAASIGATNVSVQPGVPKADIADVLAAADALVLHLADKPLYRVTIPSKLQFYMASGKPVLAAVNGEAAEIVTSSGAGVAAAAQDARAIATAMVTLATSSAVELAAMGKAARVAYDEVYSFDKAIAATNAVLHKAVHDHAQ